MADTLPNVPLPGETWVNIYEASGITIGKQIKVQNIGVTAVRLYAGATAPSKPNTAYVLLERGIQAQNQDGDAGAWAFSPQNAGLLSVGEL